MNQRTTSGAALRRLPKTRKSGSELDLTTQVLQGAGSTPTQSGDRPSGARRNAGHHGPSGADAREIFADAVRELDRALMKSASETHSALEQLASRGRDFSDNDSEGSAGQPEKVGTGLCGCGEPYRGGDDQQSPARNDGACRQRPKCRGGGECSSRRHVAGPICRR